MKSTILERDLPLQLIKFNIKPMYYKMFGTDTVIDKINQWYRRQCLRIDPKIYGKLIYIKSDILNYWVKNDLFNKRELSNWLLVWKKNVNPIFHYTEK